MPSIKEIYNSIGEVELNADSINLNVDGLEALASTQQADVALIKADLANGVTINQPVAVTDNSGSLTVDGTVTANAGTGTFAVSAASLPLPSGAATSANQTTANTSLSNIDTDLGAQADASASSDTGTFSLISLVKRILGTKLPDQSSGRIPVALASAGTNGSTAPTTANLYGGTDGTNLRAISVDSGGVANVNARPRNGAITRTTGSTSATPNTSAQALASDTNRRYLLIQNISDTDMYFNFGATATTDNLFIAKNGSGIVFETGYVPTDAVNVICSAASKKYFILSA